MLLASFVVFFDPGMDRADSRLATGSSKSAP